jgi:hypothetical protein
VVLGSLLRKGGGLEGQDDMNVDISGQIQSSDYRLQFCTHGLFAPNQQRDIHQRVGDNSLTKSISTEYLHGQVMAQKILIHVLLGERVIADPDDGFALYHMLAAALQATRRGKDISDDAKQGCIKILEEAISALEFMRTDPARI